MKKKKKKKNIPDHISVVPLVHFWHKLDSDILVMCISRAGLFTMR